MTTTTANSNGTKKAQQQQQEQEQQVERPALPYLFEKQLIEQQHKCKYNIHEQFIPARKTHSIEGKFYARHELNLPRVGVFLAYTQLTQHKRRGRDGCFPRLESQVYGWSPSSLSDAHIWQLNCVCAPKRRCEMTVHGEKLASERITERPAFNGLRFFLH